MTAWTDEQVIMTGIAVNRYLNDKVDDLSVEQFLELLEVSSQLTAERERREHER